MSCIQDCCSFLFGRSDNQEREPLNRSSSSARAPARRQRREAVASRRAHPQSARSVEQTGRSVNAMVIKVFMQDGEVKFQPQGVDEPCNESQMTRAIEAMKQDSGGRFILPISWEGNVHQPETMEAILRVVTTTGIAKPPELQE